MRAVGDQVWVGGEYTLALDADHVVTYPRANLAVFDFNTGDVLPFVADTNAKIRAIESDDQSTVWVSGNFTEVRGQTVGHIAAFDAFTGQFSATFDAVANNDINAMVLHDGWLYLGGEFTSINGHSNDFLVRVDPTTGELDTGFAPVLDSNVRGLAAWGDRVYAVGHFELVDSAPNQVVRRWVAGFDAETGAPAGPDFALPALGAGEGAGKAGVRSVAVSPDGDYLFTGDNRNDVTGWNRLTGQEVWDQRSEGDVQALAADDTSVYVGFHDGWDYKGDERLLVAIDHETGARDNTWAPLMNRFWGVWGIDIAAGAVLAVGDFTEVNGESSPRLVVFHSPSWQGAEPLVRPPSEPGDVNCDFNIGIGDALVILQYTVGSRTEATTCPIDAATEIHTPSADVNNDLSVGIADALLILQCTVSIPNAFCP